MSFRWNPLSRRAGLPIRPSSAPKARRRAALESLEDRTLLSGTIPLNSNSWTSIGPNGVDNTAAFGGAQGTGGPASGRITGIAGDPNDPSTVYVAAAGGGVWKSTNAGQNWAPLTDTQPTLFIGSIAISSNVPTPLNPQVIYAGTGEANNSSDSYQGQGVLKSTDGGNSWTVLNAAGFARKTIGKIVVDPTSPLVVYAAVSANGVNSTPGGTGIYKSIDGGVTWNDTTAGISTTDTYSDLVINPANPQILYASVGTNVGSAANGVYESADGGGTWVRAGNFPMGAGDGRISLAIAASRPGEILASVAKPAGNGTGLKALELSTDGGVTWNPLGNTPDFLGANGNYANAVAIDPNNSAVLYAAGSIDGSGANSVIESTNRGASWTDITVDSQGTEPHTASHALAFDASGRLLDGNDGGIWRLNASAPASFQWANINGDLAITQFNSVALDQSTPNNAYGGAQAQGVSVFHDNPVWSMILGGDGGNVAVDPTNPQTIYYESSGVNLHRSLNGGVTGVTIGAGINAADPTAPYAPLVIDPSNVNHILFATNRVYSSTDQGTTFTPISTPGANGFTDATPIKSLAIAATDPNTIYAVTSDAKVFVTRDAGATWVEHDIPNAADTINQIVVDPANALTAYAVRNAFDAAPNTGHVFETTDGGVTWADISGNLPDVPSWSFAVNDVANQIYVGTDTGVFASNNGGTSWAPFKTGLPNAQVVSLQFSQPLDLLIAGTHGRGAFEIIGQQQLTVTPDLTTAQEGQAISVATPVAEFTDPTLPASPATAYSATINWGDGTSSPASSISKLPNGNFGIFAPHTYAEEGVYSVFVSVTGPSNRTGNNLSNVTVSDAPLSAAFVTPTISATEGVAFSGVVATFRDANPQGTPDDFTPTIVWGDGTTTIGTVVAAPAPAAAGTFQVIGTHTYGAAQVGTTQRLRVTVKDVGGAVSPAINNTANVQDALLTAVTPGPTIDAVAGASFTTVIGSFTDADTTSNANYYAVFVDWGDGTTSVFNQGSGAVAPNGNQFDITAGHTYASTGRFTITTTVFDEGPPGTFISGNQATITATAVVGSAGLAAAAANPISGTEGLPFSGRVATFSSANQTATAADFQTPVIDWGDGTPPTAGTLVSLGRGKFAVTGAHNYAEESTTPFTFTVSIQSVGSNVPTVVSNLATIADAPISATAVALIGGIAGVPLTGLVATFTDGNPQAPLSDFTATIDFGDGNGPVPGVVSQPGGVGTAFAVTGTVTYPNGGDFPMTVTVNDVGGQSSADSITNIVTEGPFSVTAAVIPTLLEGGSFTGTVGFLRPSNPNALASEFLATIQYSDGSFEQGTLTSVGNGLYAISSSTNHVFPEEGNYSINVSVLSISSGVTLSASSDVTVVDAPITQTPVPAIPLVGTAGSPVSGVVASFNENPVAPLSDFTATIDWGDGTPPTAGVVVNGAGGSFDVTGTHTYEVPGLTFTPTVQVTDVGGSTGTLTGSVVLTDATLTSTSLPITAVQGRVFRGPVSTFSDADLFATAAEFVARIDWGDGTRPTFGTITGSNGIFDVSGSHIFNTVAAATPVTVTIIHNVGPGGATATSTGFAHVLALVSGSLAPGSDTGPSNHDGITRVTAPVFTGHADAGATVILLAAPAGKPSARTVVGSTVANASGVWALRINALAPGAYFVFASEVDPTTGVVAQTSPLSTGSRGGQLVIATSGPTVSSVAIAGSTLHVIFQTGPASIYLAGLLNTRNYVLDLINSSGTLTPLAATRITTTNLGSGRIEANLVYGSKTLANGGYVVTLHAAGLIDLAGNPLVERNLVTFPQTTNSPNPDYVAQINVTNGKSSVPVQYISLAERQAAAAYLASLRGRVVIRVPHPRGAPTTVRLAGR